MKYQCPYCNSFDVHITEDGKIVCFGCFNICSDNHMAMKPNSNDLPPPFPEELERRKLKRFSRKTY